MKTKGQSMIEYAMLVLCIVAALAAMQVYLKRAIEGRVKVKADELGDPYDAKRVSAAMMTTVDSEMTSAAEFVSAGFSDQYGRPVLGYQSEVTQSQSTNRVGSETYGAE